MLKFLRLTAILSSVLILSIAETAFSSSITAGSQYPGIPNSDRDNLFCYMQTEDGRILNLNNLCGKQVKELVLSCPTITDLQVRARIAQMCGNDDRCLASAGCRQLPRD
jgi:hypothetical protein